MCHGLSPLPISQRPRYVLSVPTSILSEPSSPLPIVVGVDGSEHSKVALAWAARQAALTSSTLVVVTAWHLPVNYGWGVPLPDDLDFEADAKAMLESVIKEVLGSDPGIALNTHVTEGHPARVLTEESKGASLIVVASRGHGEFAGMLLGSVSEYLTAHSHCPVVVVRDAQEAARSR